jgi:Ca2+-binding RTX toxin-like protein
VRTGDQIRIQDIVFTMDTGPSTTAVVPLSTLTTDSWRLHIAAGDDHIIGNENFDMIFGGPGNDLTWGFTGHDTIYAGSGNDTITGDAGDDLIWAGAGNDVIDGGYDPLGLDNDIIGIEGHRAAFDVWSNPDGSVTIADNRAAWATQGTFIVRNVETFWFQDGDFTLAKMLAWTPPWVIPETPVVTPLPPSGPTPVFRTGTSKSETLKGAAGNDVLKGQSGNDKLYGYSGNDRLSGGTGNDLISGGSGSDVIWGNAGKDTMSGGSGNDVFAFDTKPSAGTADKISDFSVPHDAIWLENKVFTKLGKAGSEAAPAQLKKSFFTIGSKAKDENDFIVYDKTKGVLYYDADGSGSKYQQVEIATLSKKLAMTYKDFLVI